MSAADRDLQDGDHGDDSAPVLAVMFADRGQRQGLGLPGPGRSAAGDEVLGVDPNLHLHETDSVNAKRLFALRDNPAALGVVRTEVQDGLIFRGLVPGHGGILGGKPQHDGDLTG
jgi:hypothetical protein